MLRTPICNLYIYSLMSLSSRGNEIFNINFALDQLFLDAKAFGVAEVALVEGVHAFIDVRGHRVGIASQHLLMSLHEIVIRLRTHYYFYKL